MKKPEWKKAARHVKQEIGADLAYERPPYEWCYREVETHYEAAWALAGEGAGRLTRTQALLVEMIKPLARKVGARASTEAPQRQA